jgi:predicted O-methyltransferase YrrM
MQPWLKRLALCLPSLRRMFEERNHLRQRTAELEAELAIYKTWVPPGHYYSPLHDLRILRDREAELFGDRPREFAAVDLNLATQWLFLERVEEAYPTLPFGEETRPPLHYHFGLIQYQYMDAITYWGMLHTAQPKRVIEIGVGHSSMVLLDARDRLFGGHLDVTFIDPYPDLLRSLLPEAEFSTLNIRIEPVQRTPLELFDALQAGDVLFIDSTHVSKAGSDVNHLFFNVLPRLKPGVLVHLHDIFYPFEYLKENVYYGIAWTEVYLLRAFLQFNSEFEIVLFPTLLLELDRPRFERNLPLAMKNTGGSIWLRRK